MYFLKAKNSPNEVFSFSKCSDGRYPNFFHVNKQRKDLNFYKVPKAEADSNNDLISYRENIYPQYGEEDGSQEEEDF